MNQRSHPFVCVVPIRVFAEPGGRIELPLQVSFQDSFWVPATYLSFVARIRTTRGAGGSIEVEPAPAAEVDHGSSSQWIGVLLVDPSKVIIAICHQTAMTCR